ncbi:MAG: hypothetical protein ACREF1_08700, partial [Acetobacteraceae bacterium]
MCARPTQEFRDLGRAVAARDVLGAHMAQYDARQDRLVRRPQCRRVADMIAPGVHRALRRRARVVEARGDEGALHHRHYREPQVEGEQRARPAVGAEAGEGPPVMA